MLNISKEQFRSIYKDTKLIDSIDLFYGKPNNESELLNEYLPSKLWRLNNLYTIVNKYGQRIKFNMNLSQHKVYAAALKHSRLIILKSRQQGISTLWLVSFFDDAITKRDFSIGLMAQGQDEASTLLERTKILWDNVPSAFKTYLNLAIATDNTKALSLNNGSSIFVRTSFRSTTLQRLHISEMGKIANKYPEKAQETKTGTLQAIAVGNTAVIESTAEGDNLFKDMWDNAIKNADNISGKDFMPVFLSWIDDPDCVEHREQIITAKQQEYFTSIEAQLGVTLTQEQKNFWVVQYRELGDKIHQEYPSTPVEAFMATKEGTYYARLYLEYVKNFKREIPNLYDKNLDVCISVDLGMNDTNVLTVFQIYKEEKRIIDEIYDSGKGIEYYTDILKTKPYYKNITHVILPHDAAVRESTSGLTRKEKFELELKDLNCYIEMLERTSRAEGIESVRQMLKNLWIDPVNCPYLIECLYNYAKEWDDKRNRFRDIPNHDEYSNGADSIRYMAVGHRKYTPRGSNTITRRAGIDV